MIISIIFASYALLANAAVPTAHLNFSDCKLITVEQLNANPDSCKDTRFDGSCMEKMKDGITGIKHGCLDKMSESVLLAMPSKFMVQITKGDHNEIPKKPEFIKAFLDRNDWDKNPVIELVSRLAGDIKVLEDLKRSRTPARLMARLFPSEAFHLVPPEFCANFDKDMCEALKSDALKKVTPKCFRKLPDEFFRAMESDMFAKISPEVFEHIKIRQMNAIPRDAWKGMTVDQASKLGNLPNVPAVSSSSDSAQKVEEVKDRNKYIAGHPCSVAKKWKSDLTKEAGAALTDRCKEVWVNSGLITAPSSFGLIAMIIVGLIAIMA